MAIPHKNIFFFTNIFVCNFAHVKVLSFYKKFIFEMSSLPGQSPIKKVYHDAISFDQD